jgi:hypothetical protein
MQILREHTGLNVTDFARETGISRPSVKLLEAGSHAGSVTWRAIRERWPAELRDCRLNADDFLEGRVMSAALRDRG